MKASSAISCVSWSEWGTELLQKTVSPRNCLWPIRAVQMGRMSKAFSARNAQSSSGRLYTKSLLGRNSLRVPRKIARYLHVLLQTVSLVFNLCLDFFIIGWLRICQHCRVHKLSKLDQRRDSRHVSADTKRCGVWSRGGANSRLHISNYWPAHASDS